MTTTYQDRRIDITTTCTATTFLTDQLTCTSGYLASLLRLVRTLTLVSQILLNVQVDSMIIGFNAENRIVQSYLSTGIFTFNIKYAQLHVTFQLIRLNLLRQEQNPSPTEDCAPAIP